MNYLVWNGSMMGVLTRVKAALKPSSSPQALTAIVMIDVEDVEVLVDRVYRCLNGTDDVKKTW